MSFEQRDLHYSFLFLQWPMQLSWAECSGYLCCILPFYFIYNSYSRKVITSCCHWAYIFANEFEWFHPLCRNCAGYSISPSQRNTWIPSQTLRILISKWQLLKQPCGASLNTAYEKSWEGYDIEFHSNIKRITSTFKVKYRKRSSNICSTTVLWQQ